MQYLTDAELAELHARALMVAERGWEMAHAQEYANALAEELGEGTVNGTPEKVVELAKLVQAKRAKGEEEPKQKPKKEEPKPELKVEEPEPVKEEPKVETKEPVKTEEPLKHDELSKGDSIVLDFVTSNLKVEVDVVNTEEAKEESKEVKTEVKEKPAKGKKGSK